MLGDKLKKARKAKNFTQDDIAAFLSVRRQTYSAYERGVSIPDAITLRRLAEFFDVNADFLLEDADGGLTRKELSNKKELSVEDQQIAEEIYNKLVEVGFIENGEKITDRHLDVLFEVLAPQIEFARFKLNKSK